jgi:hypothetical protein
MPDSALQRTSQTRWYRQHELLWLAVVVAIGIGSLLTVPAAAAESPEFDDETATVTQSNVETMNVSVAPGGQATLTIESDSGDFAVESTIVDTDGDGTVPVRIDTAAVAPNADDPLLTAADGGEVRNVTVENRPHAWALPADSYHLDVTNDAGETGIATLVVEPQIVLDGADEGLNLTATANQTISGQAAIDPGETLKLRLRSSGATAYLIAAEATVRDDHSFVASVDLSHVPDNSSFEIDVRHNGSQKASAEGHVIVGDDSTDDQAQRDTDRSGPIALEYEGDRIELASAANRTVRGTSDLEDGTELDIRLRSSGGSPFLQNNRATVDSDGSFATTFNMSEIRPGTEFTVTVTAVNDTDRSTSAPGVVVQPDDSTDGSNSMDIDEEGSSDRAELISGLPGSISSIVAIGTAASLAMVGIVYMVGLDQK